MLELILSMLVVTVPYLLTDGDPQVEVRGCGAPRAGEVTISPVTAPTNYLVQTLVRVNTITDIATYSLEVWYPRHLLEFQRAEFVEWGRALPLSAFQDDSRQPKIRIVGMQNDGEYIPINTETSLIKLEFITKGSGLGEFEIKNMGGNFTDYIPCTVSPVNIDQKSWSSIKNNYRSSAEIINEKDASNNNASLHYD